MSCRTMTVQILLGCALWLHVVTVSAMAQDEEMQMDREAVMSEEASMSDEGSAMEHEHSPAMHEGSMMHEGAHEMHDGRGVVRSVDAEHRMLNIAHEPMPSLGWPGMRMNFEATENVDLSGIEAGQKVKFTLQVDENGDYRVCELEPVE